ncbi:MAG: DNA translocase FtsK [Lachnospiraceae bacterium]|nr:DNA translocase FtsK [Lachnospiraceae bacterium]
MCRYLGKVATVVILVALAIIFVLLISGEAILAYIREAKDRPKKVKEKPDGKNGDDEENDDIYVNDRFMRDEPEFRKRIRLQSPVVIEKVPDRRDPDDDFLLFEEDGETKETGFIDSLRKRGKEMLRDRDVTEPAQEKEPSRQEREEMIKAAFDLEEIGKRAGLEEEAEDEDEDDNALYKQELRRKYGSKPKIDIPRLRQSQYSDAIIIGQHSDSGYYVDDPEMADERAKSFTRREVAEEENAEEAFDERPAGFEQAGFEKEETSVPKAADTVPVPAETEAVKRPAKKAEKSSPAETKAAVEEIDSQVEEKAAEAGPKYVFPPITLLKKSSGKAKTTSDRELKETARKLEETFESFGVSVTVTDVSCGPSVTRYELHPEQGVKVSRITALADDIKLNLAASDIRIEAPIPGKAAVGIEIPNKENTMVRLRDLIETEEFENYDSNIAFAVGKDIAGKTVVTDIARMPHLLIAGATGSGKSVCINTLIMSIIYKADPADVKMIMVDPKVVELNVYNGIPHLLIPVVTDPKKASAALNWAVAEMTNRYNLFAGAGVRDLASYNKKIEEEMKKPRQEGEPELLLTKLPQIVIIIDELADLMMVAPGEVEDAICRLAQLARAAGLHLVIATQRPSVNVITGLIKANVPSRIAFAVSSAIDSRTIIDSGGAEKLLGRGDMLFFPSGYPKPVRLQGAFISDSEVSDVVEFLKNSSESANTYNEEITKHIEQAQTTDLKAQTVTDDGRDEYFAEAGKFIIEKEKASIGLLQRVFKIGFNRAARIMDQLAEAGVVGEEEGTKPRKILMTMAEFEKLVGGGEE